ncbi:MAG: helix-turn-helix domain-containing protein [Ktedonobacterales bacterium]
MTERPGATSAAPSPAPPAPLNRASHAGDAAASPVADFIIKQARRRGRSQRELARQLDMSPSALSRLLSGKSRWSRKTPDAFADALELSDAERKRFRSLCERRYPPLHRELREPQPAPQSHSMARTVGSRAGRRAHAATSAIGVIIEPLLRQSDMTRSDLAHALGVGASTVTRMMSGEHASMYAISPQRVADVFHLEGVTRRAFLSQALALGVFALASGPPALPALRYHAFDGCSMWANLLARWHNRARCMIPYWQLRSRVPIEQRRSGASRRR